MEEGVSGFLVNILIVVSIFPLEPTVSVLRCVIRRTPGMLYPVILLR